MVPPGPFFICPGSDFPFALSGPRAKAKAMVRRGKIVGSPSSDSTALFCDQLDESLQVIRDTIAVSAAVLPSEVVDTLTERLSGCRGLIASLREAGAPAAERRTKVTGICDLLHELQHVLEAHEEVLAGRNLTYRLRAVRHLPGAGITAEQGRLIASELTSYAVTLAAPRSVLEIRLREVPLRRGSGLECTIGVDAPSFTEQDRYRFFEEFAVAPPETNRLTAFAVCREILESCRGQLWVETPAKGEVALTFVVPCIQEVDTARPVRVKCDVMVNNYAAVSAIHGAAKAEVLLKQIETQVKQLVRHPIDAVAAFAPRGVVSAILDLPGDVADIVMARVRAALSKEQFHIGRQPVPLELAYQVAPLP